MSIHDRRLKIKGARGVGGWARIGAEIIVIILVFGAVFLIGRLSVLSDNTQSNRIDVKYPPLVATNRSVYGAKSVMDDGSDTGVDGTQEISKELVDEPANWAFAASKTGKNYYPKGCSGLNRVKPENRVYFTTREQAESAGYALSAACEL